MARKRHSAEQIVNKLREAEVHLSQGLSVKQMCRQIGVMTCPQSLYQSSTV